MGKSEWDGYDYKSNYDSSYDEPSSYRNALEYDDVMTHEKSTFRNWDFMNHQSHKFFGKKFEIYRFSGLPRS